MNRIIVFVFLVISAIFAPFGYKQLNAGFRLSKLQLDFPNEPQWETHADIDLNLILNQNYKFMGKGTQSYVFESADGQYVIKLFRFDRMKKEGTTQLFNAAKIAYDHLREETGLIYLHLNLSDAQLPLLKCRDALGRKLQIPLDQIRFAVQRKALSFRKCLEDLAERQKRLDQFFALLETRTAKKIGNSDSNLSRNFGFLSDRAIEIDFGSYYFDPDLNQAEETGRYVQKLRDWLEAYD